MEEKPRSRFSKDIEELFSSGTVILFICAATSDFPILSVSQNSEKILGFAPSYFIEHENGWSDRIHPDDKEEVFDQFCKVIEEGGGAINEYRFKTEWGEYIWLRDEIKVVENEDGDKLIYGSSIDITERKKAEITLKENKTEELKQEINRRKRAEEKLQKRLEYEKVISQSSKLLLESNSSKALEKSLELLQDVTEADRIFLYKNKEVKGDLYLDPVLEVTETGIDPIVENLDRTFKYSDVPWLYEKLSSLQKVHAQIDELPEPEQSILKNQQVQSILIIPFTVEDEWKGYIGLADTRKKRKWNDQEISLLETTSRIIAAFEKRKAIEESLVEQRNYTNTILDNLPSIYLLMDENLQLVQWNSSAERYTGYRGDELKTKTAFDLIKAGHHESLEEAVDQAREQKGRGTELDILTKSGETIPFFWRGYFIEFDNEQFFLCVGIDITQQKETEQELRNEKRFNEALLESLPGIFYMFDEEGNYHRWNQNLLDRTGYTEEDMQWITPDILFGKEELDAVEKVIERVFEVGQSEIESKLKTKDGKKIPYYLTGKLFKQDGNNYLLGVGHDMSEQVKAREKLRRSEKLFRNLFLDAPAGIVMVGPENEVLAINESFENMFGFSKEELKGKDVDEFIVPEEERGEVPRMPLKEYASESFNREAKRLTKDGDLIDVFIAAIPVYIDDKPIAGFGMYIDITEEKEYEHEITSSLKEKKVMLKEIHHRVKNNLAIVSGLLQLQMYESDNPLIHDTLEESERRIQTMALIHEQLYNSETLESISCDTYLGDLVETIRNTIGSDQEVEVTADIESIELNIEQAVPFALLVNEVVTNSFKHAFDGGSDNVITIRVTEENGQVQARLSDNGKGLPDDLEPEMSDTLGMNLIDNFAQQLEAEWEIGSDNGTYVNLLFSIDGEGKDSV
ncbi:PAS domain S-box protein [Fodinibius sp. AD559]|uniref:PAS domain S-box protein n=1 Tax=Fodinibius sp. AD559 TaxID=3424179 RepID=UPI0040468A94